MRIQFWGGPKDGDMLEKVYSPSPRIYCASGESECIKEEEFLNDIKHVGNRTTQYHAYMLDNLDNGTVVYKYDGLE